MQENEESQQRGESAPASATHAPGQRPRHERWLLASAVAATVSFIAAIGPGFAMATGDDHSIQRWVQPLPLPEPDAEIAASASEEAGAIAAEIPAAVEWRTVEIKPGQTMGAVFASLSLPGATLHRLLERPGLREPLTRVRAGARFDFRIDSAGELAGLRFERDETSIATVLIEGDTIREEITQRDIQHRVNLAHGTIEGSLVGAAGKVGIGYGTVLEMAKVFGYDIDFSQDLRVGDTFSVVYEEIYRDGERLRSGDILAASFLRIPVEFTRISSLFTTARRHPVLGTMRAHKGVDYAARTGTPIMAAGEGRISFAGWQNGYGRTVIVDHGRGYTTLYGHMSRLGGYAKGARVRQGDTIGYVGASGLATGPHLHYEFRINGAHRDPLKVTLPKPEPLPRSELARFQAQTAPLLAKLELLEGKQRYAAN